MNVNQKIEAALSELVSGNIWPLSCPLEIKPSEFIVYLPESEEPGDYGDDRDLEWVHSMEINWYRKEQGSRKAVNYLSARNQIRKALRDAGFSVSGITPMFEKDTGYTHLVFSCNIIEEEPYGEV